MKRKKTRRSALDDVLAAQVKAPVRVQEAARPARADRQDGKVMLSVRIDAELADRMRDICWNLGHGLTPARAAERALLAWCDEQEIAHNNGRRFPPRTEPIARGRPPK